MLTQVDPRSLLVLNAVIENGSMSRAARSLGWTHAAVSQHMARLERRVGVPLLLRQPRGVVPTRAGQELGDVARDLAGLCALADRTAQQLHDDDARRVRVAAFPTACATFLVETVSRLSTTGDGPELELVSAEPPTALDLLRTGEVDLAVVIDEPADHRRYVSTRLLDDPLMVVLPQAHPWARHPAVALEQLAGETVLGGCSHCAARLVRLAADAGVTITPHRQQTDDYVLLEALVALGQGVAVLPYLAVRLHQREDVTVVPLEPQLSRSIYLVRSARARRHATDRAAEAITEHAGQTHAGLPSWHR